MLDFSSLQVIKSSVDIFEKHILVQSQHKSVSWACIVQEDMMAIVLAGIKSYESLNLFCQTGLDFF